MRAMRPRKRCNSDAWAPASRWPVENCMPWNRQHNALFCSTAQHVHDCQEMVVVVIRRGYNRSDAAAVGGGGRMARAESPIAWTDFPCLRFSKTS